MLLSVLLCLATLGCGGEAPSEQWPENRSDWGASWPDSPSAGDSGRAARVVNGRATVAGYAFDVPRAWTAVSGGELVSGSGDETTGRVIEAMGLTPEQFADLARQVDLTLVDLDTAGQPIADTISVVRSPGPLESPAGLEQDLASIQADLVRRGVEETGAGPVRRIVYTQRAPVGPDMAGEMLALGDDGRLVVATVLTGRRGKTTRLAEQVLDSMRPAG